MQRNAVARRITVRDDGTGSSTEPTTKKRRESGGMDEWNDTMENELAERRE